MADIIRETDEYVRYDIDFDEIVDAAQQVEAAAEGYDDLDTRLDDMDTTIAGKASATHTHASNAVTAMTGYSMPSSTSAIAASDTLNAAVGKLEKQADINKTNISSIDAATAFVRKRTTVSASSRTISYTMSKDDFRAGTNDSGVYIITVVPWGTTAPVTMYTIAYSGGYLSQRTATKICGSDITFTFSGSTFEFDTSGLVTIYAMQ